MHKSNHTLRYMNARGSGSQRAGSEAVIQRGSLWAFFSRVRFNSIINYSGRKPEFPSYGPVKAILMGVNFNRKGITEYMYKTSQNASLCLLLVHEKTVSEEIRLERPCVVSPY